MYQFPMGKVKFNLAISNAKSPKKVSIPYGKGKGLKTRHVPYQKSK